MISLDGIWYPIVHGDRADQTAVLVALGVDLAGEKEILTMIPGGEERKDAWLTLLADLTKRGVQAVDLFSSFHSRLL